MEFNSGFKGLISFSVSRWPVEEWKTRYLLWKAPL